MSGYQLATEFRQRTWFDEEHREATPTFDLEHGFSHVVVDSPQGFNNSVAQIWEAASSALAIVRLHGRNTSTWNAKGLTACTDQFDYDYSRDELAELAERIEDLAARVDLLQVIFNNNFEDQGQRNAETLRGLLGERERPE